MKRVYTTRRDMLRSVGFGGLGLAAGCCSPEFGAASGNASTDGRWYRGNLHMHTYWSDGSALPEQAIGMYKNLGYDFLALTDHNVFADDRGRWMPVVEQTKGWPPQVSKAIFESYVREFGQEAETRTRDGKTEVRLKTYAEMRRRFEEPGKFLLMPGVEITQHIKEKDGVEVHVNYINLPDVAPCVKGGPLNKNIEGGRDVAEVLRENAEQVHGMAQAMRRPYLLMLNHPQWRHWDIQPQHLIDTPEIRFFELCNGGSGFTPHSDALSHTTDKFWDAVNAFRCKKGAPLIYGTGTDDTHGYFNKGGYLGESALKAWVMVRSSTMSAENILAAMAGGDFYTSCGVALDYLDFSPAKRALRVKVRAEPGVRYKVRFIVTKKNFDTAVRMVEHPPVKGEPKRGMRVIPVYSGDIGMTAKLVDGPEASYTMKPEDLYVRAKIESDLPGRYKAHFYPLTQAAWTQPYLNR
ncbi:MAG: hypothetical protein PHG96_07265 [Kiritimatiellae bacterium]|nr:hypothetical protein [Kiritimatiellia bacterium]MDD3545141.1 hypothetical protein [Kiritimatiellia bacterium]MDD4025409.1 hypothetical protein [Kiritimatiellia bacterium]MDD4623039.1 hypothetical protein [Kiritimatiellia bacterium]